MVIGIAVTAVYFGAVIIALIQMARGRFRVDYDKMAQEAIQEYLQSKRQRS